MFCRIQLRTRLTTRPKHEHPAGSCQDGLDGCRLRSRWTGTTMPCTLSPSSPRHPIPAASCWTWTISSRGSLPKRRRHAQFLDLPGHPGLRPGVGSDHRHQPAGLELPAVSRRDPAVQTGRARLLRVDQSVPTLSVLCSSRPDPTRGRSATRRRPEVKARRSGCSAWTSARGDNDGVCHVHHVVLPRECSVVRGCARRAALPMGRLRSTGRVMLLRGSGRD